MLNIYFAQWMLIIKLIKLSAMIPTIWINWNWVQVCKKYAPMAELFVMSPKELSLVIYSSIGKNRSDLLKPDSIFPKQIKFKKFKLKFNLKKSTDLPWITFMMNAPKSSLNNSSYKGSLRERTFLYCSKMKLSYIF